MKRLVVAVLLAACGGAPKKPIANPDQPPAAPKDLTTAEQVIETSLVNEGGRAKLAKITTLHMTGTLTIGQVGLKGQLDTMSAAPNDSLTKLDIKGAGHIESGVHGDVAWEKTSLTGARVLTGPEKSLALREATFNGDLEWKKLYPKAELKGIVKFANQDCYQVELTAADGQAQTRYYAKDTVLPIGLEMIAESQMGKVPVKVVSSDWRPENGLMYPHKMSREEASQAIEITIDKIETNIAIPPGTFDLSDEIKQLAATAK